MDISSRGPDELIIYDGASTSNPILYNSTFHGANPGPGKVTSSGSCLTFEFKASVIGSLSGWEALISCGEGDFDACEDGFEGANQLTGNQTEDAQFETNKSISSDQKIQNAAVVDYDAGTSIILLPGFEVTAGASFHAFIDGCAEASTVENDPVNAKIVIPQNTIIAQNPEIKIYPNPTTTEANIALHLPESEQIYLDIFDLNGRRVSQLIAGQWLEGGQHLLQWNSQSVEAGIYFLVLNGRPAQKLVVIR